MVNIAVSILIYDFQVSFLSQYQQKNLSLVKRLSETLAGFLGPRPNLHLYIVVLFKMTAFLILLIEYNLIWVFFFTVRIVINEMDFIKSRDEDEMANLIWNDSAVQHEKIAELRNYQVHYINDHVKSANLVW